MYFRRNEIMKRVLSILISAILVMSVFTVVPFSASAATKRVSLKKTSATLKITKKAFGKTTIKIKKAKGIKVTKKTFTIKNKKIAKVSKKGVVTAKSEGKTKVTVKVKYKFKKKAYTKKLTFKVTVKDKRKLASAPTVKPTKAPASDATDSSEAVTEATQPVTETTTEASEPSAPWVTEDASASEGQIESTSPTETNTSIDDSVPESEYNPWGDTSHCIVTEPVSESEYGPWGDTGHCIVTEPVSESEYDPWGDTSHCIVTEPVSQPPTESQNIYETTPPSGVTTEPQTEPATEAFKPVTFNEKLMDFSNRLYQMCSKNEDKNYVMSPVSVYMAMSMLYSAGDDAVKAEVEKLVGMNDADFAKTADLFNQLSREYYGYNSYNFGEESEEPVLTSKLSLTNSIWFDENVTVNKEAVEEFNNNLKSDSFKASFRDDNKAANEKVREFIKEKTNGLIDKDFGLSAETIFSLINTLYFKDIWNDQGSDLYAKEMNFKTDNGSKKVEFLMGHSIKGQVQETDNSQFFYTRTEHGYKLKFILPKEGYTVKDVMTADNLNKINSTTDFKDFVDDTYHYTHCTFPSFKIDCDTSMFSILQEAGFFKDLPAFTSPLADESSLKVSNIAHTAVLDVQKEGIEGAAVTIIDIAASCAPDEHKEEYHEFLLDRSFGFILTDYNNVVIFEGQVTDPTI